MFISPRIHLVALFFAVAFVLANACASAPPKVRMVTSPDIPAAQGTVEVEEAANGNTELRVEVRHLAKPERIRPDGTTYVVWVKQSGARPQNMGALKVDGDLRGSLTTVTPLKSIDVFITVEQSPTVSAPSARNLLSASIAR